MHIIAISNQKGGVGKTTTAISLAAFLADMGRRVLLIDMDPQANATSGVGTDKRIQPGLYEALTKRVSLDDVLRATDHGFMLLPAGPELAAAELELVNIDGREFVLKSLLEQLAFDYVIIDCPPSLGLLTVNALAAAKHLVIPVQAEYYALEGLSQLLDTVGRVQQGVNPDLRLTGVLLTMHAARTSLATQVHQELKKHFDDRVFDAVIPRTVRLAEAPSFGKPIHKHDRWGKGARSYKQFAKEVEKRVTS